MENYFVTTIEALTNRHVNLVTSEMVNLRGETIKIREERNSYANSKSGRQLVKKELEEPYLSSILAVWGDTTTVEEPSTQPEE